MGNTVGSINVNKLLSKLLSTSEGAYILGLWCADGYHRTSSIGLSNKDEELIEKFALFLLKVFSKDRLRVRVYYPLEAKEIRASERVAKITRRIVYYPSPKARQTSYHLYVNSRSLLRIFRLGRSKLLNMKKRVVISYIAGRFDGDGSIDKRKDRGFRIVYGNHKEAEIDRCLLKRIGIHKVSIYHYKQAKTFCLYLWRSETLRVVKLLLPFSIRLQKLTFIPRRDSILK